MTKTAHIRAATMKRLTRFRRRNMRRMAIPKMMKEIKASSVKVRVSRVMGATH
jgi:hypothetical protein